MSGDDACTAGVPGKVQKNHTPVPSELNKNKKRTPAPPGSTLTLNSYNDQSPSHIYSSSLTTSNFSSPAPSSFDPFREGREVEGKR